MTNDEQVLVLQSSTLTDVYHRIDEDGTKQCGMRQVERDHRPVSLEQAKRMGLRECRRCAGTVETTGSTKGRWPV